MLVTNHMKETSMKARCEENDAERDVTPPRKKLKQARLPFQILGPDLVGSPVKHQKKRKISEDVYDDIKIIKVIKPNEARTVDAKENVLEDATVRECEVGKSSDSSNTESIEPQANTVDARQNVLKNDTCESEIDKCISSTEMLTKTSENPDDREELVIKESPADECEVEKCSDSVESDQNIIHIDAPDDGVLHTLNVDSEAKPAYSEKTGSDNSGSEALSDEDPDNVSVEELKSGIGTSQNDTGDEIVECDGAKSVEGDLTPKRSSPNSKTPKSRKLTPKQILKRQESAKKKEERERQKHERERRKAEEKEERQRLKLEKEEQKKKEKEEKEEQKKREKGEKEKKRLAELELKSEEKRKKEEQRGVEKRKKDEKKLAEEEAKKKEAAAFVNFFVSARNGSKLVEDMKVTTQAFMPFQVKGDMRLAPVRRNKVDDKKKKNLEVLLTNQTQNKLFLEELRDKLHEPRSCGRTWPLSDLQEEVIIIDHDGDNDKVPVMEANEVIQSHPRFSHRPKLLQFWENQRPPYWGTWRKKSKVIKPQLPFEKDGTHFDYEVDSDDEWEEEEPGESLHGSDDEKESEDEYEVDNEFFVPHGYLSDEENDQEGEEALSPETQKAKLKLLEMEFEEEMKHKTERIKPRLIGCIWVQDNTDPIGAQVLQLLSSYRAVYRDCPVALPASRTDSESSPAQDKQGSGTPGSRKKKFPESAVPTLIKLIHGNINRRGFLVQEFLAYLQKQETAQLNENTNSINGSKEPVHVVGNISKLSVSNKIKDIASWAAYPEEGPMYNRMCWYVPSEIRIAYGVDDLVVPNKVWNYSITPKRELELPNMIPSPLLTNEATPRIKSLPLITKFTKKMSQGELQKQLLLSGQTDDGIQILHESKVGGANCKTNKPGLITKFTKQILCEPEKGSITELSKEDKKVPEISNLGRKNQKNQRKRVSILKSAPLGQEIDRSSSKAVLGVANQTTVCDKEDILQEENCVVLSD